MTAPLSILIAEAVLLALFVVRGEGWGVRLLSVVLFVITLAGAAPRYLPLALIPGAVLLSRIISIRRSELLPAPNTSSPSRINQAQADQQTARLARQEALTAAHGELERHHACVVRLESLK